MYEGFEGCMVDALDAMVPIRKVQILVMPNITCGLGDKRITL